MWRYIKKAGELIGAFIGLYTLWSCGVEYGYKKRQIEYTNEQGDEDV